MNIEQALYALLTTDTGVSALIGTRLYPLTIAQDVALPAAAYQRISGPRKHAHDGPLSVAEGRFQFTCQAATYAAAKSVANAIRQALDGYNGAVTVGEDSLEIEGSFLVNELDGYEFETEAETVRLDYLILYQEA